MKLTLINKKSVIKISTSELINLHYRVHLLHGIERKHRINLTSIHNLLVNEMKKRGIKHKSEIRENLFNLNDYLSYISEEDNTKTIIKDKYKKERDKLKKSKDDKLDKLKNQSLTDNMDKIIKDKKDKIIKLYKIRKTVLNKQEFDELKIITKFLKNKKVILVSGLTIASTIIYLSYKIYKDDTKKYNKLCSKLKGYEKELCISTKRIKALTKRFIFLNKLSFRCKHSKDPLKCKIRLDEEMLKIRERIRIESTKIGKKVTKQ